MVYVTMSRYVSGHLWPAKPWLRACIFILKILSTPSKLQCVFPWEFLLCLQAIRDPSVLFLVSLPCDFISVITCLAFVCACVRAYVPVFCLYVRAYLFVSFHLVSAA